MDYAEDGRVRTDSQRQCEHGDNREGWIFYQHPHAVADILPSSSHQPSFFAASSRSDSFLLATDHFLFTPLPLVFALPGSSRRPIARCDRRTPPKRRCASLERS